MTDDNGRNIYGEVVEMLIDVVGEDFLLDTEVTPDTTFGEDLALESIEFVALSEKLQDRYRGRVNFVEFVAGMDIHQITLITVGELVEHIERCIAEPAESAR